MDAHRLQLYYTMCRAATAAFVLATGGFVALVVLEAVKSVFGLIVVSVMAVTAALVGLGIVAVFADVDIAARLGTF